MHWYVVTSQKELRIFVKTSERQQLKLLTVLINPLGGVKRKDLIGKQAGSGVRTAGRGSVHFSEQKRRDPHEDAVIQFARQAVRFLEKEKLKGNFDSLSIVAEPHLLGKLRAEMKSNLKDSVTRWIKKDLQKTPKNKLVNLLLSKKSKATEQIQRLP